MSACVFRTSTFALKLISALMRSRKAVATSPELPDGAPVAPVTGAPSRAGPAQAPLP